MYKSSIWSYEAEYRILTGAHGIRTPTCLGSDQVYRFPPEAVTRVFLGCAISAEHRNVVRSWLEGRHASTTLWEAQLPAGRFELEFRELR
jgi:hypothetical protein